MDAWEHADDLDDQNRRPAPITTNLDKLVNWDCVAANLTAFGLRVPRSLEKPKHTQPEGAFQSA